jgi:dihydrofolate synthase/folylpolyglutamate synthase
VSPRPACPAFRPLTPLQVRSYLKALERFGVKLGLDNVRALLRALGDPQQAYPCLHVAGTNGKGSVCAILESVLRRAGLRTGLYTSPHLSCVRERIRVAGRPVPERDFGRLVGRVVRADPRSELTFFELLTAAAFLHFRESGVEAAVLETGQIGRAHV